MRTERRSKLIVERIEHMKEEEFRKSIIIEEKRLYGTGENK